MRRQRKKRIKTNQNKLTLWFFVVMALFSFLLFNETGVITWIKLKNEKEKNLTKIESLLNQQIKIKKEIEQLESDEEYLQKIAREKFMMVKPGERVYRVKEDKEIDEY